MQKNTMIENDTVKKVGVGIGLIGIVVGIILLVVSLQPEPTDVATVEQNEQTTDPTLGPDTAPVVVREYSDFQCPSCQAAHPIVKDLLAEYGDKVQFVYNDFPLRSIHPYAQSAAVSGQCAFDQQKFFEMHDMLFDRQRSWSQSTSEEEAKKAFRSYAKELDLNMEQYDTCLSNTDIIDSIEEDVAEGDQLNVTGTPTFFVNGKLVSTREGYEPGLRAAIDAALAE